MYIQIHKYLHGKVCLTVDSISKVVLFSDLGTLDVDGQDDNGKDVSNDAKK